MAVSTRMVTAIKVIGLVWLGLAAYGSYLFWTAFLSQGSPSFVGTGTTMSKLFVFAGTFWILLNILVAIGMLFHKKWGFILVRAYLYILLLGIPIGTAISILLLSYLKKQEIREYFGYQSPQTE